MTSRSATRRRPFSHKARSPQVRTHTFTAQSPDLRHFALITRASRSYAHSPCSAAPSIRFLFIDSRFMLHASSPHSVALMQLRFTSFAVINLRRDFHPQACAHAGRTNKNPSAMAGVFVCMVRKEGLEPTRQRRQNLNLVRLPISPLPLRGLGFHHLIKITPTW